MFYYVHDLSRSRLNGKQLSLLVADDVLAACVARWYHSVLDVVLTAVN